MNYPVWINSDILAGPLNNTETTPVNAKIFFDQAKQLNSSVFSIGWTTKWGNNFTTGSYTDKQITDMVDVIKVQHDFLSIFCMLTY